MIPDLAVALRRARAADLGGEVVLRSGHVVRAVAVRDVSRDRVVVSDHQGAECVVDATEIAAFTTATRIGQWW